MKSIIDREESVVVNIDIEKNNGLTREQGDKMMGVIRKVILQIIRPDELVATIQKDIGLDEAAAEKLALDLLGRRFLAMEFYLGGIRPLIQQLGGNVDQYLAEAKKRYPEVYQAAPAPTAAPVAPAPSAVVATKPTAQPSASSSLLDGLEERLTTFRGRAEVLLRMTALSQQVETAINAKVIDDSRGQALLQALDALSYAVNTQDLNPLEVQAIKRRLAKVVAETESLKQ